ncbi:unnamed protein product [Owenia fusiformis]|uniref:Uncharacterized protein n=1 Tax=Owenia fusiformis TaxID=6347 RepID=A0A8J1XIN9_OWEFU|nr:unnamed protein product [Owenia fusiformis]
MKLLTVILLLALNDACICSHDESSDESSESSDESSESSKLNVEDVEEELKEFLSDFSDAFKVPECATNMNPDCSAVGASYAEDGILALQGVPTAFGREAIAQLTEGFKTSIPSAFVEVNIENIKVDKRSATAFGIQTLFVDGEIVSENRVLIHFIKECDEKEDSKEDNEWKIQYLLDNNIDV